MPSDELKEIVRKFFSDDSEISFYGSKDEVEKEIVPFLRNLISFERPDGFSKIENKVMILEHFEFDSTQNSSKKGSETRVELARIDRKNKQIPLTETDIYKDVVKCTHHINQYIDNAINGFLNHYSKIQSYKEHLKSDNIIDDRTDIKVMFLIEDVTILGNIDLKTREPIILIKCDKFLDVFEKSENIDYILCFSSVNGQNKIWFLSRASIDTYRRNELKVNELEIIDFEPQTISFTFTINEK
jgi:hypothetical protein